MLASLLREGLWVHFKRETKTARKTQRIYLVFLSARPFLRFQNGSAKKTEVQKAAGRLTQRSFDPAVV